METTSERKSRARVPHAKSHFSGSQRQEASLACNVAFRKSIKNEISSGFSPHNRLKDVFVTIIRRIYNPLRLMSNVNPPGKLTIKKDFPMRAWNLAPPSFALSFCALSSQYERNSKQATCMPSCAPRFVMLRHFLCLGAFSLLFVKKL